MTQQDLDKELQEAVAAWREQGTELSLKLVDTVEGPLVVLLETMSSHYDVSIKSCDGWWAIGLSPLKLELQSHIASARSLNLAVLRAVGQLLKE